ncbi:replication factor C subunit 2 [Sporodiniella umbellata]|nr:replication factor C subunit 2 [Sporodiniella umbellata]
MSLNFFAAKSSATTPKGGKKPSARHIQPWVEKYRPKTIDDISSQEQTILVLKKALQSDNLPHLLFYGPPGTGKTSTILALANELYGPQLMKSRVLELNASDERGISVVREKVKNFSKTTLTNKVSGFPCPPYKIIILDEADSMTKDAQSALRRTMETYSSTTRFCIVCNYVSRIIEPITSRCAKFRYKPLSIDKIESRLDMISSEENVQLGPNTMKALIESSGGDLRKAITFLQSGFILVGESQPITPAMVYEMAGRIPEEIIQQCIEAWSSQETDDIENVAERIVLDGYSSENLLVQLHDAVVKDETLSTLQKSHISQILSNTDISLIQGGDEHLQILNLLMQISAIVQAA